MFLIRQQTLKKKRNGLDHGYYLVSDDNGYFMKCIYLYSKNEETLRIFEGNN